MHIFFYYFSVFLLEPQNKRWANQQKLHTPCATTLITLATTNIFFAFVSLDEIHFIDEDETQK